VKVSSGIKTHIAENSKPLLQKKKWFIGVLYMKHRVLYSAPKKLLC